ncbi:MAG: hypothetical protein JJE46_10460 [Acidimicrobiia bacterium]|nr:hypothetical protein [Acidimicrobiia bacterium]
MAVDFGHERTGKTILDDLRPGRGLAGPAHEAERIVAQCEKPLLDTAIALGSVRVGQLADRFDGLIGRQEGVGLSERSVRIFGRTPLPANAKHRELPLFIGDAPVCCQPEHFGELPGYPY